MQESVLNNFVSFCSEYLDVTDFNKIIDDDIIEFFYTVQFFEFIHSEEDIYEEVKKLFSKLFKYLNYNFELDLLTGFDSFLETHNNDLERCLNISRIFNKEHSYLNHLLDTSKNVALLDGFFEIIEIHHDFFVVKDIYIDDQPIQLHTGIISERKKLKIGDIIHGQIEIEDYFTVLAYMSAVYPKQAIEYMF